MTLNPLRTLAAVVIGTALLGTSIFAQTRPATPESPYGGNAVEEIVARVNDQIITRSDYERAQKELDTDAHQHGATMQETSDAHKDLLRNLIDQQLWLSKGKELSINGETELIQRLNEIRKQYNLETLEDLEKAAKEQGVSFEDFKANIRNGIITQLVMRDQVGRRIQFTPGEVQRFFEQHKQDYVQQENEHLSEILISTGAPVPVVAGVTPAADPAAVAAAKAKADDIEAKLHAGGDFAQLAKSFSEGTTAAEGGDIGEFRRGNLAKVLEDQTFALKAGQYTDPILTKQGYVIFKVVQHTPGGVPEYKDVEQEAEQNYYMSKMEPAMRDYLTKMREEAYIDVRPGYVDTGASPKEIKPIYSAYTPPTPKKKKKVERTRFRETTHTFRQRGGDNSATLVPASATVTKGAPSTAAAPVSMKPGKKEKIRFGKSPTKTLPSAPETKTEDAGGGQPAVADATPEPVNPLDATTKAEQKTRFSARAKQPKQPKGSAAQGDKLAPAPPDAAEVADRQAQAAPLGLAGDTSAKKKKKATTTSEKTRLTDKNKKPDAPAATPTSAPAAPAQQAPADQGAPTAPTPAPAPTPQQ